MTTTKNHIRQLGRIVAVGLLCFSPALLGCGKKADTAERAKLDARLQQLEAKAEIHSILVDFSRAVDDGDSSALTSLGPDLATDFRLDMKDLLGNDLHFEGLQGLVLGFGPIINAAEAEGTPGAIDLDLDLDNDSATAQFKVIASVKPQPELGVDVNVKVMVFVDTTATLVREDDGSWKLRTIQLTNSLAYPGALELIGG